MLPKLKCKNKTEMSHNLKKILNMLIFFRACRFSCLKKCLSWEGSEVPNSDCRLPPIYMTTRHPVILQPKSPPYTPQQNVYSKPYSSSYSYQSTNFGSVHNNVQHEQPEAPSEEYDYYTSDYLKVRKSDLLYLCKIIL